MDESENKPFDRPTQRKVIVYSSVIYLISFLFVYFMSELSIHLTALSYGLESYIFQYKTILFQSRQYVQMTTESLLAVNIAGPLSCLILGLLLYRFKIVFSNRRGYLNIFLIWSYLHAFNFFLGGFVSAVITGSGFGFLANWIDVRISIRAILSITFLGIFSYIGSSSAYYFLESAFENHLINKRNRHAYILCIVFLPWLFCSLLLILISIPSNSWYDTLLYFTMLFAIMPIFNKAGELHEIYLFSWQNRYQVNRLVYVIAVVFLILFRIYIR